MSSSLDPSQMQKTITHAQIFIRISKNAMKEKKVFRSFDSHRRALDLIYAYIQASFPDYPCTCVHRFVISSFIAPHFLHPQSALPHTTVRFVLDWTQPWTFLGELYTWLSSTERRVQGDGGRELEEGHTPKTLRTLYVAFNLHSHHLSSDHYLSGRAHFKHYTEPSAEPLLATSSALQGTILPRGQGTSRPCTTPPSPYLAHIPRQS